MACRTVCLLKPNSSHSSFSEFSLSPGLSSFFSSLSFTQSTTSLYLGFLSIRSLPSYPVVFILSQVVFFLFPRLFTWFACREYKKGNSCVLSVLNKGIPLILCIFTAFFLSLLQRLPITFTIVQTKPHVNILMKL